MNEKFPLALPENTILAGQYVIVRVLGQGGFGITYEAIDHKTGQKVAVKEFFPDTMATRTQTTVTAFAGEREEGFAYGKECFLQEAETLAEFIGNPNIVRVHTYFEENGTAYFVMDFIEGTSFDVYLKERGGRISYEEAEKILLPVMDALAAVHSKGIVHRDVTPDNIYITKDGTVKLLDFGAARYSLGDKSKSLDVVLKHGFAPKEQYTRHGRQGPFTDVYALGATFYFAITGRRPPDSIDRLEEDTLIPPSKLGVEIPPLKENAILFALNVQPNKRFQSMAAFVQALSQTSIQQKAPEQPQPVTPQVQPQPVTPQVQPVTPQMQPTTPWTPPPSIQSGNDQNRLIVAVIVAIVVALFVLVVAGLPGLIVIAVIAAIVFAVGKSKMKW
jgi:serine/threonine protein kinase